MLSIINFTTDYLKVCCSLSINLHILISEYGLGKCVPLMKIAKNPQPEI